MLDIYVSEIDLINDETGQLSRREAFGPGWLLVVERHGGIYRALGSGGNLLADSTGEGQWYRRGRDSQVKMAFSEIDRLVDNGFCMRSLRNFPELQKYVDRAIEFLPERTKWSDVRVQVDPIGLMNVPEVLVMLRRTGKIPDNCNAKEDALAGLDALFDDPEIDWSGFEQALADVLHIKPESPKMDSPG